MCELDERRIREAAKLPPRVMRGAGEAASREEARKAVDGLALISDRGRDSNSAEDLD